MARCFNCHRELATDADICAYCQTDLRPSEQIKWVSIARLTNLAEAGYFADLLDDSGVPVNVRQHDRFSAVDGTWACDYFLQVPEGEAERAGALLQKDLANGPEEDYDQTAAADPLPPVWKPVAAMLVAGGLVYWASHGMGRERPAPRTPTKLWQVLGGKLDRPLTTTREPGRSTFRLRVDGARSIIYLDEDRDGDGLIDRQYEFHQGELRPAG